ncbi:MAG: HDOD domain-containing protein [Syntrophales bacterium]
MMAVHLLIIVLTAIVIAIIWYAVSDRKQEPDRKQKARPVTVKERRPASGPPPGEQPLQESAAKPSDRNSSPVPAPDGIDEPPRDPQASLKDGIALIFSDVPPPSEQVAPLRRIEDIRGDVGLRVLSHIASLKNVDSVHRLQRMLSDPKTSMKDLSVMITSNPILSAKILQTANSAYYGMAQKMNSISHAIMIIGMANIKAIIYHEGVLQALNEQNFRNNPTMKTIWQHSNYTSIYASYLHYLFGDLNMGTLFTLGLLHDIGKFIMLKLPQITAGDGKPPRDYSSDWTLEEEDRIYGINHALVGQLAVRHWGLSPLIVKTIALHHDPAVLDAETLGVDQEIQHYLLILFLADQAAHLFSGSGGDDVRVDRLHPSYHGLIDRQKLSQLIVDKSLIGQLREAEAITSVYA